MCEFKNCLCLQKQIFSFKEVPTNFFIYLSKMVVDRGENYGIIHLRSIRKWVFSYKVILIPVLCVSKHPNDR